MLHEHLTLRDLLGCGLMFAGLLVVQLPPLLRSPTTSSEERKTNSSPKSHGSGSIS
jgi:hypothetical protein